MGSIKHQGFTLIEATVTFTLMLVLLAIVLSTNFFFQIRKGIDTRKKGDLDLIQRAIEEYYDDHHMYPPLHEMIYATMDDSALAGRVCGKRYASPEVLKYMREVPCNPDSPTSDYVYFLANGGQDYAIFTLLANPTDPSSVNAGCESGCSYYKNPNNPQQSISTNYFNYKVSSTSFYVPKCMPSEYIGCYPGKSSGSRCQRCPMLGCSGYERIFCRADWCAASCK